MVLREDEMNVQYQRNGVTVALEKSGLDRYVKASYPIRYGRYSEVETPNGIYQFNLSGEIIFAKGKGDDWPNRQEWLKRTQGNDWIYYSTGGYTGVFEAIGEYYLPNMEYSTNSLLGGRPFALSAVRNIVDTWFDEIDTACAILHDVPDEIGLFLEKVKSNHPQKLEEKAKRLFTICGDRVSVLPPDTRHVDYNIIPLSIATGCLYKCRFCKVKTRHSFSQRKRVEIDEQLDLLCEAYGADLINYNSVFLGDHDCLAAEGEVILYGVEQSLARFGLASSTIRGANFFLFGSVDALLNCDERLFLEMGKIPAEFYINIGLESADQKTLDHLGKPITAQMVETAFTRMQEINSRYLNIEVSGNFLMDENLPKNHYPRLMHLVRDSLTRKKPKGCIYLSPLRFNSPSRELVYDFNRLKLQSRLPTFLYIIQRL